MTRILTLTALLGLGLFPLAAQAAPSEAFTRLQTASAACCATEACCKPDADCCKPKADCCKPAPTAQSCCEAGGDCCDDGAACCPATRQ